MLSEEAGFSLNDSLLTGRDASVINSFPWLLFYQFPVVRARVGHEHASVTRHSQKTGSFKCASHETGGLVLLRYASCSVDPSL
jgi:hypothetical protein